MYRILIFSFLCIMAFSTVMGQNQNGQPTTNQTAAPSATAQPATTPAAKPSSTQPPLTVFDAYLWCAVGILLSIMLPILKVLIPKPKPPTEAKGFGEQGKKAWEILRPYVITTIFSLLTAILIVAFATDSLKTWNIAVLAGYAWDSTLQKIGAKP